jgi:squalene-associated FAD-dependent desaturase
MTVHVVGAGLSGLAAAVALAREGVQVILYEAAAQAGGRCRSYHDRALDRVIDNGNHLVLSGNRNVRRYLETIGASDRLIGPAEEGFRFVDLARGRDFTLRANAGPVPWWIAVPGRNVPDTGWRDYRHIVRLAFARQGETVADLLPRDELFRVLWEPLAVSALNTPIDEASARGFWRVLAKTMARGGAFSRPLIARDTLADTFIAPAIDYVARRGAKLQLGARVRNLAFDAGGVTGITVDDHAFDAAIDDRLILAVPPAVAARLVPGLKVPTVDEPIVNAHFAISEAADVPVAIVAIVGGAAQWAFRRPGLVSVTVSAARGMVDEPAEILASCLWADVVRAFPDLPDALPPYRIVKEKRATIRQSPADEALRPSTGIGFANLFLAGDWTRTGLPATIEGSILSGFRAAHAVLSRKI